jgi:hypothetical protein
MNDYLCTVRLDVLPRRSQARAKHVSVEFGARMRLSKFKRAACPEVWSVV